MLSFGEDPLNEGDTASVQCVIMKGDSPLEITFMFNGSPINSSLDVAISKTGKRAKQLMIDYVTARHAGEYTCVASNLAGSTSRSTLLAVNGTMIKYKNFYFRSLVLNSARCLL